MPSSRASDAASFIALAQNLGIVLALAMSGAIFQNRALDQLQRLLPNVSRNTLRGAISGTDSGLLRPLSGDTRGKVLHAVVEAMSQTYYLVVAAGALAIVGSLFMKVSPIHDSVMGEKELIFGFRGNGSSSRQPSQHRRRLPHPS